VRGLTSADMSRDFFITSIPLDSYNTDRVEISRGPNAMLFGLGSPAGIINNSLLTANLRRRMTTVELRNDQYGSLRTSLDHNQVLLRDKLALRVAVRLRGQSSTRSRKPGAATSARSSPAPTGRSRTPRSASPGEIGAVDSNMPESRPPFDAYSFWWDAGRPGWDPSTNTGRVLGTPAAGYPNPFTATGAPAAIGAASGNTGRLFSAQLGAVGGGNRPMVIVYNDPNSSTPNLGLPGSDVMGIRAGNYPGISINAAGAQVQTEMRGMRDSAYILNNVLHWNDITAGFWKSTQVTDPGIFDFYHHMLHGPNKHEWSRFHTYNATIEQRLLEGRAGVELAFNRDSLENGNWLGLDSIISGYALRVDMQTKLPDGRANPNFGRPFTVAYSKASVHSLDRDTGRATGYYNLDLRKVGSSRPWLGNLLGVHRITGTYSKYVNTAFLSDGNFAMVPGTDFSLAQWGVVDNNGSGRRGLPIMRYLGPDVSQSATPAKGCDLRADESVAGQPQLREDPFLRRPGRWRPHAGHMERAQLQHRRNGEHDLDATRRYVTFTREKVDSAVGIAQSYWLRGKLVSTLGWRRDDVRTYNAGTAAIDPNTGLALIGSDYQPKPVLKQSETSFNYGVVAHSPDFVESRLPFGSQISVSYNEADNFKPAGQRYDIFDTPISAETGHTQEYGAMLNTFRGSSCCGSVTTRPPPVCRLRSSPDFRPRRDSS
jgi:hypothetical protein